VPNTGSVLLGVSTPNAPYDMSELDVFERDAGKRAGVVMYFQGWAYDEFNPNLAASVAARGSIPEITWEPWDYKLGADQPAYALGRIIDGSHDAYITRWAQGAKAFGGPLLMRFAHEMNDRQYPWSEQVNGNQPGQYAAAWRHVVQIFRAVGANNVSWIWAPNVSYQGTTPLAGLYPGDDYVDWIGVDGYNGGTALPWGGWLTFAQVFGSTLNEISALSPTKPVMIAETASAEAGGSKAAWITDFFAELAARPQIKGFVWFNHNKEADWRIESSDAARLAFAAGVADPRYR
jgi:beta-mannanase